MSCCINCGRALTSDEQGLYKKLINRGATEAMCIDCLSEKINVPQDILLDKIEQFRRMGCTLFPRKSAI